MPIYAIASRVNLSKEAEELYKRENAEAKALAQHYDESDSGLWREEYADTWEVVSLKMFETPQAGNLRWKVDTVLFTYSAPCGLVPPPTVWEEIVKWMGKLNCNYIGSLYGVTTVAVSKKHIVDVFTELKGEGKVSNMPYAVMRDYCRDRI